MRRLAPVVLLVVGSLLGASTAAAQSSFGTGVESGDGDVGESLVTQGAPENFVYLDADNDDQVDKDSDPIFLSVDSSELTQGVTLANSDDESGTPIDSGLRDREVQSLDQTLGFVGAGSSFEAGDTIVADHKGDDDQVDVLDVLVSGPEAGTVASSESDFLSRSHDEYDGEVAYIDDDNSDHFAASNDFAYFDTDADGQVSANDVRLFDREYPGQSVDTDGDGIEDSDDNCPETANEDQTDSDGDGTGDACDDDRDGDGVPNSEDECPDEAGSEANDGCPEETDTDGDGVPDSEDECPEEEGTEANDGCPEEEEPNATDGPDRDDDGVPDGEDNCPNEANPDQEDLDEDGLGDACDSDIDGDGLSNTRERQIGTDAADSDTDGDGVPDGEDNCPQTANEDQADGDGDGTGDACDEEEQGSPAPGAALVAIVVAVAGWIGARKRR